MCPEGDRVPALPVVANVIRFTIEGTTPTHPWVNVFYWRYTGVAPTVANLNDFCDDALAAWVSRFQALALTASSFERATAVDLSSTLGSSGEFSSHQPGTRGTAELPGSCAVLLSKHIGRRYRGGHPRSYLAIGLQTDLADTSHWATGLLVATDGAYAAFTTDMALTHGSTTLDAEVCVSYVDKGTNPLPPHRRVVPLVLPVLGVSVEARVASQRRRIAA